MPAQVRVDVFLGETRLSTAVASGPIDIGRVDPSPTVTPPETLGTPLVQPDGTTRFPIADPGETAISRHQLLVRPLGAGSVEVGNVSKEIVVHFRNDRSRLLPGTTVERKLPVHLEIALDRHRLQVNLADAAAGTAPPVAPPPTINDTLVPLEHSTLFVDSAPVGAGKQPLGDVLAAMEESSVHQLVEWWKYVIAVLQSASDSDQFFDKAAEAVCSLVQLDVGEVFLYRDGRWASVAKRAQPGAVPHSQSVLESVRVLKQTLRSRPQAGGDIALSQVRIEAYVASPIVDGHDGNVIGALYGHRSRGFGGAEGRDISPLEALLVETLACGLATGLARVKEKEKAIAEKVKFAQFFTPKLAAQLESQPDLLTGRDAAVSVLFCDIVGFSSVAEKVGTAMTMEWISDVLTELSSKVVETEGVLVDYVGDELMAMWGAPTAQEDHAERACRAAKAMLDAQETINERWFGRIHTKTTYSIGVNSGNARVGNTGSTMKFKYGPLGNVVNLASRVRGTTKFFKVDAIITGDTRDELQKGFLTRRLCSVRVINIDKPVELHELNPGDDPRRRELFDRYDEGLAAFESGQFANATRILGQLVNDHPKDGPSLVLLSRSVDAMVNPDKYSAVWDLPSK